VVGGAVRGTDVYGRFPVVGINTSDDVGQGRLLPNISVDQYAATLGRWFGLSETQLREVMPNLVHFPERDLGSCASRSQQRNPQPRMAARWLKKDLTIYLQCALLGCVGDSRWFGGGFSGIVAARGQPDV
jgi:hypothetical protein